MEQLGKILMMQTEMGWSSVRGVGILPFMESLVIRGEGDNPLYSMIGPLFALKRFIIRAKLSLLNFY